MKPLTSLINQVLNTGQFPDKLNVAKVIPICKKNNPTLFTNYRPISLLPVISKVLERIMNNQLLMYFTNTKLLSDNQYGFRPHHSTEYAAVEIVDRITTQLDNNKLPISIFVDLSKAFDTLEKTILLKKLEHYRMESSALQLLKNYLTNREQFVKIYDIKSNVLPINTGVPQGSILCPLLFIVYVNDFSQASTVFKLITYADDPSLVSTFGSFTNSTNNSNTEYMINTELHNIAEWLKLNKLTLNINKTKYMIFQMPNKKVIVPTLTVDGVDIEKVQHFNLLGLILDTGEPLSTVQPPESLSRRSRHRGASLAGQPPGSRSRRSSHRGASLDGPATGEPLSTVQPPGSRSRRSSHRGAPLDGPTTGEPLSTVQPPRSRSRRPSHRGAALDGPTTTTTQC